MTKDRMLTLKFVFAAQDAERMEKLSWSVATEVLNPDVLIDDTHTPDRREMTFAKITPLKLEDAYLVINDMVREKEDVVMTSVSLPGQDEITVIHRNTISQKVAELAP